MLRFLKIHIEWSDLNLLIFDIDKPYQVLAKFNMSFDEEL